MESFKIIDNQAVARSGFSNGGALGGLGLASGGMVNAGTGLGTAMDKSQLNYFTATRLNSRQELEILYNESWACQKFIDIPVDDMFIRPRVFEDMDEKVIDTLKEQEKRFNVNSRLARAIKGGRLMGTAVMIALTREAPLDKPFNAERMRPGDLLNFLVVDRFDLTVLAWETDPTDINYGNPSLYSVTLTRGGRFDIHASRLIRFDGMRSLSMNGWTTYDEDWGVSEVVPVITSIYQDNALATGIAHLTQETSIPVMKIDDFEDAIQGNCDAEMSLSQRAEAVSAAKSIFRTIFMGKNEEFERHAVNWTGLPDLMDRYAQRLSAAADIPATRFNGQSPLGMNSTGEGDQQNYALKVAATQVKQLEDPYEFIDMILMKDAGIQGEVNYVFPSLIDMSEKDKAEIADKKADTALKLTTPGIIDENEARAMLNGDEVIGTLEEMPDDFFEEDEETTDDDRELKQFMKKSAASLIGNGKKDT